MKILIFLFCCVLLLTGCQQKNNTTFNETSIESLEEFIPEENNPPIPSIQEEEPSIIEDDNSSNPKEDVSIEHDPSNIDPPAIEDLNFSNGGETILGLMEKENFIYDLKLNDTSIILGQTLLRDLIELGLNTSDKVEILNKHQTLLLTCNFNDEEVYLLLKNLSEVEDTMYNAAVIRISSATKNLTINGVTNGDTEEAMLEKMGEPSVIYPAEDTTLYEWNSIDGQTISISIISGFITNISVS